jgi:predicted PurR-regulated permease PerM
MKARFFWTYVMFLVLSPFAKAESDKAYSDRRLSEEIRPITNNIEALNKRIQTLESDARSLQKKVDELWNKGAKNLDALDSKVQGTGRNANIALWISLSIVLSICGTLCLVFWPRKSKTIAINPTLSDKHKCPRCGWEHGPDDTVCKNPNCRTQF